MASHSIFRLLSTAAIHSLLFLVACSTPPQPSEKSLRMIKQDQRVYANRVVDERHTLTNEANVVLGAPEFTFSGVMVLGDGYVVVDMGEGEEVVDGPGDDLRVWETGVEYYGHFGRGGKMDELYEVLVSADLKEWVSLGRKRGTSDFDLGRWGVPVARYVKIVGDSEGNIVYSNPGPDIDAVEALNMAGAVAGAAATPDQALTREKEPRRQQQAKIDQLKAIRQNSVAVIIGNRNYNRRNPDVPDVDFAHNDHELVRALVLEQMGYKEGNVIALKDASQAALINVFGSDREYRGQLYDWIKPGVSEVFVYYSGHGAPSLADGKGYLLPVDANPNRVELNGYALDTLYANLSKLDARRITVVIDACFSGSAQSGPLVRNASSISLKQVQSPPVAQGKLVLLTAAGAGEVASWDTTRQNGLFTRLFVDGVKGEADSSTHGNLDGQVTLGELKGYLGDEVSYFARRHFSREQHPEVHGPETLMLLQSP